MVRLALARIGLTLEPPLAEIGSPAAAIATALALAVPVLLPAVLVGALGNGELAVRRVRGLRFERHFAMLLAGRPAEMDHSVRVFARHVLEWRADHLVPAVACTS